MAGPVLRKMVGQDPKFHMNASMRCPQPRWKETVHVPAAPLPPCALARALQPNPPLDSMGGVRSGAAVGRQDQVQFCVD
eukprot:6000746-Prymnesium_polylepis.1